MGQSSIGMVESAAAVIVYNLKDSSSWWHDINASPLWQDRIFHGLAILYGLVAVVAMVQLVHIQVWCRSTLGPCRKSSTFSTLLSMQFEQQYVFSAGKYWSCIQRLDLI